MIEFLVLISVIISCIVLLAGYRVINDKLNELLTQQEETFATAEQNGDLIAILLGIVESNLTDEQRDKFEIHGACKCPGGCKCVDAEIEEKVGLTD
jgi:Co/Zn/Cd efflux system component